MKKRYALRLAALPLLALFAAPLRAGEKLGETYTVPTDVVGVSGSVSLATESGWFGRSTMGSSLGNAEMVSSSTNSYSVFPGLWSAGPGFLAFGDASVLSYGEESHPVQLLISSGTFPMDFLVFMSSDPATQPLYVSPTVIQQATSNLAKSFGDGTRPVDNRLWEFAVLDSEGARLTSNFQKSITLKLPYNDADDDGIVDGSSPPIDEKTLTIWWLDETHSLWVKLPASAVDTANNVVFIEIRHFSVFTIMSAPTLGSGEGFAFPVPWRPGGANAGLGSGQTGTAGDGITFTNLLDSSKIRIYTLSGGLVREIHHGVGPQESWDVKNDAGEDVATGTYIYIIETAGSRKKGTLAVVR